MFDHKLKYAAGGLFALSISLFYIGPAQAIQVMAASWTPQVIATETAGTLTNGTTINFTLDGPADVEVDITRNGTGEAITTLHQSYSGLGAKQLFWSGFWEIGGDLGRKNGFYSATIFASTGTDTTSTGLNDLLQITSIDIHNVSVTPSFDQDHSTTFPVTLLFSLAKPGKVSAVVYNSSGTLVRTLKDKQLYEGEINVSTNSIVWDGLGDDQRAVPIGIYSLYIGALDPSNNDLATVRTRDIAIQSLAGVSSDAQKVFADNVYAYPNPARDGYAIFNAIPIRDSAAIRLKIYTIVGDLVFDKDITSTLPYTWDLHNQSGRKVGRGLYYYVMQEKDSQGTLQVTKKLAVIQ